MPPIDDLPDCCGKAWHSTCRHSHTLDGANKVGATACPKGDFELPHMIGVISLPQLPNLHGTNISYANICVEGI